MSPKKFQCYGMRGLVIHVSCMHANHFNKPNTLPISNKVINPRTVHKNTAAFYHQNKINFIMKKENAVQLNPIGHNSTTLSHIILQTSLRSHSQSLPLHILVLPLSNFESHCDFRIKKKSAFIQHFSSFFASN